MPVFNSEAYINAALSSVRKQSFRDFELVIVNDGSTDRSSEILRTFAQNDPRTRLIERPNRGLIDTRNQLLNEARCELIAWIDSDDMCHPDRLQKQVSAFDADPALVCVGTNIQRIDPLGRPLGVERYPEEDRDIRAEQSRGNGFRFASTMQRRRVALSAGGFRHPFRMGEDLDFLLRVAECGSLANISDVLYVYRQHLLNTCTELGLNWPDTCAIILQLAEERREHGQDRLQRGQAIELPAVKPGDDRKLLPFVLLDWADGALSAGDRLRAIRYILRSIFLAPRSSAGWRQLAKLLFR